MTSGHHALILHEWTDFSVKLGGAGVKIIYASFQVIENPKKGLDVARRLNDDLEKKGFVWLTTYGLPDPARGRWKRLLVIYSGENEYRTSSAFWGVSTAAMINLTVKASPALAALTVGSATWINEPGPSSNLCVEHRIFEDCLQLPALVPLVSLGAVAYSCYSKGVPLFMADGQCVICLCNLGPAPAEILSCGHAFHYNCIQGWLALGGCCPLCREEPACDTLMHETTNALMMMMGLFSHELSTWFTHLAQGAWF
ncbi:unnamed protein product [Cladocopium goreaui]|uniref:E3 ubiquitin-protein ligase DZIP3 (DAZ-interacting protein 3) (RING-type E3 ubiquitin transferase DZIP3) (RNA-binding ubiquitin ligase of 138 kDa) (HRUL138) n=1 Tax=Cladocopium goreaui TaxID=2562237 RepID=A0A9P1G3H1_9DINO|nr:unnamed protein product [Cladocopium goreaui]